MIEVCNCEYYTPAVFSFHVIWNTTEFTAVSGSCKDSISYFFPVWRVPLVVDGHNFNCELFNSDRYHVHAGVFEMFQWLYELRSICRLLLWTPLLQSDAQAERM